MEKIYLGCNFSLRLFFWGQFSRDHLYEGKLCRQQIVRKAIFLGSSFKGDIVKGQLFSGYFSESNNPGAIIHGAIIWGGGVIFVEGKFSSKAIVQGEIIRDAVFLGTIILRGNCPGGNNPGGAGNHPEGICLGGNYPRGNIPRGKLSWNPPSQIFALKTSEIFKSYSQWYLPKIHLNR